MGKSTEKYINKIYENKRSGYCIIVLNTSDEDYLEIEKYNGKRVLIRESTLLRDYRELTDKDFM